MKTYSALTLLMLLATCLTLGCASRKQADAMGKPLKQAELDAMIRKQAVEDPILKTQLDFGLAAHHAGTNKVLATVSNKTQKTVVVGPKCFWLLLPGQNKPVPAEAKSIKLFPVARLKSGEEASGELTFQIDAIPPGARLAFDARDGSQPAMTRIR